jgi:16S rRNA (guanine966-N2)-methyltransferase
MLKLKEARMIKVVSGKYRGRNLFTPNTDLTKPTKSMSRGGEFSAIANSLENSTVLDLFAGSGALGIESLSRGAKHVIFNDISKEACQVIKKNLIMLNENNYDLFQYDYHKMLDFCGENNLIFNIVFLDPPYKNNCYCEIIDTLVSQNNLSNKAIIVLELNGDIDLSKYDSTFTYKSYRYGYSVVYIMRRI